MFNVACSVNMIGILSHFSAGKKRNKHGSLESQYESGLRARQWVTEEVEHLLPIKDKHRFIHRTQKIPEAQEPEPGTV